MRHPQVIGAALLALLALLGALSPIGAQAQVLVDAPAAAAEVNDPNRPFILPAQKTEVTENLADFRRYSEKAQWDRAFKSLQLVLDSGTAGLVAGDTSGLLLPSQLLVRQALAGLPPEGKDAYRLFHDADARTVLETAEQQVPGSAAELEQLNKIYSNFFVTSFAAPAADRLGDLHFERGEMESAIGCWQSVLDHHPESEISRAQLLVKIATAAVRGDLAEPFATARREIEDRHSADAVTVGGRSQTAGECLARLAEIASALPVEAEVSGNAVAADVRLPEDDRQAKWQFRMFSEADAAAMVNIGRNWGWGRMTISEFVPPTVVDDKRVYVNLLGHHLALDRNTGKLLWRTARFHDVAQKAQQNNFWFAEQYSLSLAEGQLLSVFRDMNAANQGVPNAPFRLARINVENGQEIWSSANLPELANWNINGTPLVLGDRVIATALKADQGAEQYALALRLTDGGFLWSTHLGTHQTDMSQMYYQRSSQPELAARNGRVYVETHAGALLELNEQTGLIQWAYAYDAEVPTQQYWYNQQPKMLTAGAPLIVDGRVFFKGMRSDRLYSIKLDEAGLEWKRPVDESAMVIGIDDRRVYLVGGKELTALDLQTQKMAWHTPMPMTTGMVRPLLTKNRLYHFSSRGVFEIDKENGDTVRTFRGADLSSLGGAVLATPDSLITVSNLAVTAYALSSVETSPDVEQARVSE